MYICIHICSYMCIYIYICIYIYLYVCVYICIYIYIYTNIYTCTSSKPPIYCSIYIISMILFMLHSPIPMPPVLRIVTISTYIYIYAYPRKNGDIALYLATNCWCLVNYVSHKRNESNGGNQWCSILLTFMFSFTTGVFGRIKYVYSVISVHLDWLLANTKMWPIDRFLAN